MKKILIYGFYGIDNVGNEAMLKAFIEPIRQHFNGEVEFVVANRHPSTEYDAIYKVRSVKNLEYSSREKATGRWLSGLNPDDTPFLLEMLKEIASADLVVFGPGQYFVETGEFGLLKGSLGQILTILELSMLAQTPIYGLALACEPLSSPWSILMINQVINKFAYLTFRDPKSIDNLKKAGIVPDSYEVLGDMALAGERSKKENIDRIISNENLTIQDVPRLAVSLRSIYWLEDFNESVWLNKVKNVIELWLDHFDQSDVVFIPQNTYHIDSGRDDDRRVNRLVYEAINSKFSGRIHTIEGLYQPEEIEAIYGLCDVTLSARLHGSVFSCKQGTPPVVFEFMDKTTGFFDRIGFSDFLVSLEISEKDLFRKLLGAYDMKDQLSKGITTSISKIRETAKRYCDIAIQLVEDGGKNEDKKSWIKDILTQKE